MYCLNIDVKSPNPDITRISDLYSKYYLTEIIVCEKMYGEGVEVRRTTSFDIPANGNLLEFTPTQRSNALYHYIMCTLYDRVDPEQESYYELTMRVNESYKEIFTYTIDSKELVGWSGSPNVPKHIDCLVLRFSRHPEKAELVFSGVEGDFSI